MRGTSIAQARKILGHHFLGTKDAERHFGVTFSGKTFASLARIPFSVSMLKRRKKTHILFPGCNLRIPEIQERVPRELFYFRIPVKDNHAGNFAWERVRPCWHLMRKEVVPDSLGKTESEFDDMLRRGEMLPRACEAVSMIVLYYLVTGIRLFQRTCACFSCAPYDVDVGFFSENGLGVKRVLDDKPRARTGIAPVYYHFQYAPLSIQMG